MHDGFWRGFGPRQHTVISIYIIKMVTQNDLKPSISPPFENAGLNVKEQVCS